MVLGHLARAGASLATVSRLAPASLATSSRIGLDFVLPRREFSSTPLSPAPKPAKKEAGALKREAPLRYVPVNSEQYTGDGSRQVKTPTHLLSIKCSKHNVILTFSDGVGPMFGSISGGSDKVFKKGKRGDYEAAHQAMLKMIVKIQDVSQSLRSQSEGHAVNIVVVYKGLNGKGRDAVNSCISGADGHSLRPLIVRIEDHTPIPVGGTRAPGRRRL